LKAALNEFVEDNEKRGNLNDDLNTVISFLNDTSIGIGNTLEMFTGFLADQITSNHVLVLETLESASCQKINYWDCVYRNVYQLKDYGKDFNIEIPVGDIPQIMLYVNTRILSGRDCCCHCCSTRG
jgi:hypothetical protein